MWFADSILSEVDELTVIRYIGRDEVRTWNEHRRKGEIRLFTGWQWMARHGNRQQQGLKTKSAAYRDAYYALVKHQAAPRLRVIKSAA